MKLKPEHWWGIAFAIVAVGIYLHAKATISDNVSVTVGKNTAGYAVNGMAYG